MSQKGDLTLIQRCALRLVAAEELHPANGHTLRSLERRGLIAYLRGRWRITDAGSELLAKLKRQQ